MKDAVLVDMDGVLADFDGLVWERFADILNISSLDEQEHRFLTNHITGDSPSEIKARTREMRREINGSGWFYDLAVMPGAVSAIDTMIEEGLNVWLCTKPLITSESCASDKMRWVKEYFPALQNKVIIFSKQLLQFQVQLFSYQISMKLDSMLKCW